jgi:N-acetylglucosamine kinase-like BadF-type ATPase
MNYYIGVDGGGTKTEYALFDEDKNIIATVKGPGSNHENYEESFEKASSIIWDGLNDLVSMAGISLCEVKFTLMGLAGIDHRFQYDIMTEKLRNFGLERFEIFNDGFIVVKAGSKSGAAIGYNCGTGTCCNAIDSTGTMLQLAGLGDFSGDIGNGHWIAIRTFKLIYDDVYLHLQKTTMTKMFFDEVEIKSKEQFISTLEALEGENADKYIMILIDIFFKAVNSGDEVAGRQIDEMAQRGAQLIAAHIKQLDFSTDLIEVILSGSIHTKLPSDKYIKLLKEKSEQMANCKFDFIKLDKPPVYGCINWILQSYNK